MNLNNMDHEKMAYIFEGMTGEVIPDDTLAIIRSFIVVQNLYSSAIREITTKLENLNDEFRYTRDRNPIHQLKSRVKSPMSIFHKLQRRNLEISLESAKKNLTDIAGVRVICSYIDNIYMIADMFTSQEDIKILRRTDYIKNPKPNGYRSLHLIVQVPVFLSDRAEMVSVEVQIRTIAMDFWASLEHDLSYKLEGEKSGSVAADLRDCAEIIAETDKRMQNLYNNILRK